MSIERIAARDICVFGTESPKEELWIVVGRHESAVLDEEDPDQVEGYWRGTYDPPLSEKGISGAQASAFNLMDLLRGRKVLWTSSPWERARETAAIWAPKDEVVVYDHYLAPADFSDLPAAVILAWMVHQSDMLVYQQWIGTPSFWRTWVRARVTQTLLVSGMLHTAHGVDTIVAVGHCEQAAMLLCAFGSGAPEDFVRPQYQIKRGEFVIIKITPDGEIKIERPRFE